MVFWGNHQTFQGENEFLFQDIKYPFEDIGFGQDGHKYHHSHDKKDDIPIDHRHSILEGKQ